MKDITIFRKRMGVLWIPLHTLHSELLFSLLNHEFLLGLCAAPAG